MKTKRVCDKRLKDCEWGEWSDWSHCGCEICGEEPVSGRWFPVRWWVLCGKDVDVLWNAKHTSLFEKILKQKGNLYKYYKEITVHLLQFYLGANMLYGIIMQLGFTDSFGGFWEEILMPSSFQLDRTGMPRRSSTGRL